MKKTLTILFSILAFVAFAQVPQGLNYQAVARDNQGQPKQNVNIDVKFTILQGSVNGMPIYTETHSDITNVFGLFTLTIGQGITTDTFSNIDWSNGNKFLKVEIDNQLTGTTQLWSVPYSLLANEARSVSYWKQIGLDKIYTMKKTGVGTIPDNNTQLIVRGNTVGMPFSQGNILSLSSSASQGGFVFGKSDTSGTSFIQSSKLNTFSNISLNPEGGRVGIGTNNPMAKLDINGSVIIGSPNLNDPASPLSKLNIGGGIIGGRFEATGVGIIVNTTNSVIGTGTNGIVVSAGGGTSNQTGVSINVSNGSNSSDNIGVSARASGSAENVYGGYFVGAGSTFGGFAENAIGIYAQATGGTSSNKAGIFQGNVQIIGNLSKSGGSFIVDHPSDPENKYLVHSFVESPDMLNIYNGNIITSETGMAIVKLPDYFESENIDFKYQLTCIGKFSNAIILKEIEANQFTIQTSEPHTKVSWQVTGIRNDKWAKHNRIIPEVEKDNKEKGYYLHPEYFGQPESKGINSLYNLKESQVNKKE
jgi:hypothetical protein